MAKNKKKKGIIKEFKEFAIQGNLFDMAIGVIIGGVFKDLVTSFTNNIIMPIIAIFTGDVDFSELKIRLGKIQFDPETGEELTNYLRYGDFLSSVISFLILMVVVFMMVKVVNKMRNLGKKQEEEAPAAPPAPSNEEVLLTEIRDLLKNK